MLRLMRFATLTIRCALRSEDRFEYKSFVPVSLNVLADGRSEPQNREYKMKKRSSWIPAALLVVAPLVYTQNASAWTLCTCESEWTGPGLSTTWHAVRHILHGEGRTETIRLGSFLNDYESRKAQVTRPCTCTYDNFCRFPF